MRDIFGILAVALVAGMTAVSSSAQEVVVEDGAVTFVSGGIGSESVERMAALAGRFNLKLVFATQGGSYLADVNVRIDDTRGNKLLDIVSDGPWLLVRMAPGRYRIHAIFDATMVERWATVPAGGRSDLILRWQAAVD
jgi:hypothetical protein